jgi:hypothetical protein
MSDLAELLTRIAELDQAGLAAVLTAVSARLIAERAPAFSSDDDALDVAEAARRLSISPSWLYHSPNLPFAAKVGGKRVYSARGIDTYLRRRQGKP